MIFKKGVKFKLIPTKEQEIMLKKSAGTARWAYNHALNISNTYYEQYGVKVSEADLRKHITRLKNTEEYSWLYEVSVDIPKQAIRDLERSFKNFFSGKARKPKFKKKGKGNESFYVDTYKIKFTEDSKYVILPLIGKVKISKQAQKMNVGAITKRGIKLFNPRVSFDGIDWWISFSYNISYENVQLTEKILGIDLGIKNTAVCSDGRVYENINKTSNNLKKKSKRLKHLQRRLSKKYENNKEGRKYNKTNNIIKLEKQIKRLHRDIANIRKDYNHKMTTEIVKTKPSLIVMETLNIKNMLKNKHLSKSIQEQNLYAIKAMILYKSERLGIEVLEVPKNFPSTKKCSKCGSIKTKISLSQRTYYCNECGNELDRDLNAAINLKQYGRIYRNSCNLA
jgi:putative transposase